MPLIRLLLLVAVGFLLYRLWHLLTRPRNSQGSSTPAAGETVIRCEFCDVHVPSQQALSDGSHSFCSETHREAFRRERHDK